MSDSNVVPAALVEIINQLVGAKGLEALLTSLDLNSFARETTGLKSPCKSGCFLAIEKGILFI